MTAPTTYTIQGDIRQFTIVAYSDDKILRLFVQTQDEPILTIDYNDAGKIAEALLTAIKAT
jgi:hypothetical protein